MIVIEQIRAARAMLGLKQNELAEKAGVSTGTLNNIERGFQKDPKLSTLKAIQLALRNEGIEFTEDNEGYIGVKFKPKSEFSGPLPILIIDDSSADRLLYKTWLNQQPDKKYKIVEAANAREGYDYFLQSNPSCIILDFMMYGKNGFQLLMQMKKDQVKLPPIIFVTSMHNEIVQKDAKELGVHACFDKNTLTKEKLYQAINSAIA